MCIRDLLPTGESDVRPYPLGARVSLIVMEGNREGMHLSPRREEDAMRRPTNARAGGHHRSTSSALSPYLIEEVAGRRRGVRPVPLGPRSPARVARDGHDPRRVRGILVR